MKYLLALLLLVSTAAAASETFTLYPSDTATYNGSNFTFTLSTGEDSDDLAAAAKRYSDARFSSAWRHNLPADCGEPGFGVRGGNRL